MTRESCMRHRCTKLGLTAALLVGYWSLHAEDIDLFVDVPSSSADVPNVLFVLDNTANWTPHFTEEMTALSEVFNELPVNADGSAQFNIGLMFAAETSNTDNNVQGGYVRAAIR